MNALVHALWFEKIQSKEVDMRVFTLGDVKTQFGMKDSQNEYFALMNFPIDINQDSKQDVLLRISDVVTIEESLEK